MPKIKRTRAQHARQSPKAENKAKSGGNAINCRIKIDVLFSAATRFPPLFTEISHFGFCCFFTPPFAMQNVHGNRKILFGFLG